MNISKNLLYICTGIFSGNFIAVTLLLLIKDEDYVRFWNYAGFVYLPFIVIIIFLMMLGIYTVTTKIFKIDHSIGGIHLLILSFLFALFYVLGDFLLITPLINKLRAIKPLFLFYLTDPGIPYVFFPLLLFLTIVIILYKIKK